MKKNQKSSNSVLNIIAFILVAFLVVHLLSRKSMLVEPAPAPDNTSTTPFEFVREQAGSDLTVYFIPGWLTKYSSQYEQEGILRKIYPHATIISQPWESLRGWSSARKNADLFGREFATRLRQKHPNKLDKVVLVGHSLGGRVVIRTLNALGPNHHVNHAVLLGAAINYDDEELKNVGTSDDGLTFIGTKGPVLNFFHSDDRVLQEAFQAMENNVALGRAGPRPPAPKGIESFQTNPFMTVRDEPVYGQNSADGTGLHSESEDERALKNLFSLPPLEMEQRFQSLDSQIKTKIEVSNVQYGSPESHRTHTQSGPTNHHATAGSSSEPIDELATILQIDLPFETMVQSPQGFALTSPKEPTTSWIIGGVRAVMNLPSHDSREYLRFFHDKVNGLSIVRKGFVPLKIPATPPNRVN